LHTFPVNILTNPATLLCQIQSNYQILQRLEQALFAMELITGNAHYTRLHTDSSLGPNNPLS